MSRKRGASRGPKGDASPPSPTERKWIWFRHERDGRRKAREEFDELNATARAGLAQRMKRYIEGEARPKDVLHLGDGIYEIRYRERNNPHRLLFMHWGPHCVALTAFHKKQQATPQQDLRKAKDRARRWREVYGDAPAD